MGDTVKLTKRERASLNLFRETGELNEGLMYELWPLIRNPRLVTNSLLRKGLVEKGDWWDGAGYELHLTDAGRASLGVGDD
jgi:hypothetical protein